MIDCHVHIREFSVKKENLISELQSVGGEGAILLSLPPESYSNIKKSYSFKKRLANVCDWCKNSEILYPFLWIDPLDENVLLQIEEACKSHIMGFKIICDRFYPSHPTCIKVLHYIAKKKKPVIFHSGILWDCKVSSKYNRPIEFECLLEITNLKFALAHISWPWCDELIALYGKFLHSSSVDIENSPEMFIDTTPGTPALYREEVLKKLYQTGYDIEDNLIFGLDSRADMYNSDWAKDWIFRDTEILRNLDCSEEKIKKYFSQNLKRFLGINNQSLNKKIPVVGCN